MLPAAMTFVSGAVLLVGAAIERMRYRSMAAERSGHPPGPGGGEPAGAPVEARFQLTPEVFVDPTTHVRMRVLVDPRRGAALHRGGLTLLASRRLRRRVPPRRSERRRRPA